MKIVTQIRSFLKIIEIDERLRLVGKIAVGVLLFCVITIALSLIPVPVPDRIFISHSGYSLQYPGDWIVDDAYMNGALETEVIRESKGRAFISVTHHDEPSLATAQGRVAIGREIELSFTKDKNYRLDFFRWFTSYSGTQYSAYLAAGFFKNGFLELRFKEVGLLDTAGKRTVFRTEVLTPFLPEFDSMLDAALLSVQRVGDAEHSLISLSADEAKSLVEALPAVEVYREAVTQQGSGYTIEVKDAGDHWVVWMYAQGDMTDGIKLPLDRWRVDKKTGAITKAVP